MMEMFLEIMADRDGWVVKLTSSGNIVWQKTLGGTTNEYANSVTTTSLGTL
jgi:hypothetical protein